MAEAYLRLKTLPGEQAQVDWGHFGKVKIGRAERLLMAFVMVLSYGSCQGCGKQTAAGTPRRARNPFAKPRPFLGMERVKV